jgi:hypothetical protein
MPEPRESAPENSAPPSAGAGVRPAGSAETWQSWMASLSQMPGAQPAPAEDESFREMSWENALAEERAAAAAMSSAPAPVEESAEPEDIGGDETEILPVGDPEMKTEEEPVASRPQPEMPSFEDLEPPKPNPPRAAPAPAPVPYADQPRKFELESISMAPQSAPAAARSEPPMPPAEPSRPAPNPPMSAIATAPTRLPNKPAAAPYALPPRLRERLEAGEHRQNRASRATGWLIGIGALAAVVIAVVLTLRFRAQSSAPHNTSSASVPSPPAADPAPPHASAPVPPPTVEKPPVVEKPATVASSTPAPSAPKPAAALPAGASVASGTTMASETPAAAVEEVPKTLFGVAVGTFLVEGRANTEKARLMGATNLPGRVVASKDGDFAVVLGAFAVKANAENTADDLINKGVVEEARVVTFANPAYKPTAKQ